MSKQYFDLLKQMEKTNSKITRAKNSGNNKKYKEALKEREELREEINNFHKREA